MWISVDLDEETLRQAIEVAGGLDENEVVNRALRLYVRTRQQKKLLELRGHVGWQGNLDELRARQ